MNARFTVAQAGSSSTANSAAARVIKVVKPQSDQATTLNIGYDQKVKLDFADIANEKITLVHIGEKLIILFDNRSTVTVEPFFDSMGAPLQNLSVEVATGRELTGSEFATAFPITTDQSVLPAAGDGAAGAPSSGANFLSASVDPLASPNPLDLLGPEQLPGLQFTFQRNTVPEGTPPAAPAPVNGLPEVGTNPTVLVDDDVLAGIAGGTGDDADAVNVTGTLSHGYGSDGAGTTLLTALGANLPADFTATVNAAGTVLTIQQVSTNLNVLQIALSNTTDGTYAVTQLNPIAHPAGGDENNLTFTVNYVVTDGDGDTATGSITIDADDDTPTVVLADATEPSLTVDETFLATDAGPTSFAGAFTSSYGADGAGTLTYAVGFNAGATGLVDTATNLAVVLTLEAGQVVGRAGAGGPVVFTVSVDGSGNVTLDQQRAVVHTPDTGPDQSTGLTTDNLITLTATITDKDGDSQSATLNIGQNLVFKDDTATIATSGTEPSLTVDETFLATDAGPTSFAGAFTSSYGADGAGTLTYAVGFNAGATGLVDTATNLAVVLTLEAGQVVGRAGAGGPVVFTVSVDGSGNVTLDQQRAVVHTPDTGPDQSTGLTTDNLITLTATITDKDGDSQSATLNIGQNLVFKDDTATIATSGTEPSLTVDETFLATDAGPTSFAGAFTSSYGADGAGTLTYAVGFNAGATGLVDTATNLAVVLTLEAGQVVGRAGAGGPVVFTVSVDGSGNVTLDQQRAVVHTPDTGPDQSTGLTTDNLITLTATITDKDGDSQSATLNIGQNLVFKDDTATIATSGTEPSLTVDETFLATDAGPTSFAGAFTSSYGADGAGTLTYAVGFNAGATGLVDTATNLAVVLTLEAGQVVGRAGAGGPVVFTVSVDGSGNVTLDQQRAVVHTPDTGPDQSTGLTTDNLITLTATITDKDGDSQSATLNIGQNLVFKDDTATIATSGTEPSLTVDETFLATDAGPTSFAGAFTSSYGADGAGTLTYAVGFNAGATGLVDTATNLAVVLTLEAGQVVGRAGAGGPVVFTVSVDGSGNVTLDQQRAVVHTPDTGPDQSTGLTTDNLITLTATITDKDGDSQSATLNIGQNLVFKDDTATIATSGTEPSLTVDETFLATDAGPTSFAGAFTSSYGADGAGTLTYAVGFNAGATGLVDTATNLAVVLTLEAGQVVGRAGAGGPVVFTVSVDGSGNVTLDQQRAVVHTPDTGPDQSTGLTTDNLITLTATITDKDGDSQSATLNIGQNLVFKDDTATIATSGTEPSLTVDETFLATDAGPTSFAGAFTSSYGADGAGTLTYAVGFNAGATGLVDTATNLAVVLTLEAGQVVGRAGAGGPVVFTVSVDGSGNVTLDQQRAVVHTPDTGPDQSTGLTTDNLITLTATITDKDGDSQSATLNIGQNLVFKDDTATIATSGTEPSLTVDETFLATDAGPTSFAGAFTSSYGADGAGTLTYAVGFNAGATGLVDTATNLAVVLTLEAGQVVGRAGAGGPVVFTVSVDGSGNVTLDQQRAVVHTPDTGPDQSTGLTTDNLITLTATITDKDGDSQSATLNIGQNLVFKDDTATIATSGTEPSLTVDETFLATDAGPTSFAGAFTSSYGADGAGTLTYAVGFNAGATGLVDTATNLAVVLTLEAGQVVGRAGAGGPVVFTVSVDGSGNVTLDQQRAVVHTPDTGPDQSTGLTTDNLITLTATITDKDGDSQSATLNIGQNLVFKDDTATIATSGTEPSLTVDETFLATDAGPTSFAGAFTSSYGADGAGTLTYAVGFNAGATGLVDTATNLAVVLTLEAGQVVGRAGAGGPVVFTVSVDGSGNVTLDQQRAVVHTPDTGPDQSTGLTTDNLITLTATITDKDGDSQSATLNIGQNLVFKDDTATIATSGTEPSLTVDETFLATDAGPTSFAGAFTSSYGADGAGTLTYAVGFNAGATGLVDTATNLAVVLTLEAGQVVGRAGAGGPVVFTVSVDGSGNVTLDQQRAVVHTPDTGPDQSTGLTTDNLITLTATITDKDGDSQSATLNIGQNLVFKDDTATIATSGTEPSLTVDETFLATDAGPTSFAGAFTSSYGADGAGTLTYAVGFNAGATGLVDTATNLAVVLTLEAGQVVGRAGAGGPVVFTVSVDGSGNVTLDQQRAVVHTPDTGPDQSTGLTTDNLITLTATITDKDGDSQSATLNIGQNLVFKDDTATIATSGTEPSLTVDETFLATDAGPTSFAGAFTSSYGADGAGTLTYAVGFNAGATGLVDTATNLAVVLTLEAGQVVGRAGAGGPVVFTVSVDGSGNVTLDQQRAVVHTPDTGPDQSTGLTTDNLITLTATITDKDGDSQSATLNIGQNLVFKDDTATIATSGTEPSLTVDETFLATDAGPTSFAGAFTSSYGADGAGTLTYAVGFNAGATGLVDTATNLAVVLTLEAGQVVGRAGAGGPVVFTVSVDGSGNVTLDQQRAVVHTPDTGPDQSTGLTTDNLITLTATITDKDGDSQSATLNIGQNLVFKDDTATNIDPKLLVMSNTAGASGSAALDVDANIDNNYGADGAGGIRFSASLQNANSGLTSGGQAITYTVSANGLVLTASTASGTVFTITLNPDGSNALSNDTYTVNMIGTVDGGASTVSFASSAFAFVGGNDPWAGFTAVTGDRDLLLTPMENGVSDGSANTNANEGGVSGGNSVGTNEAMRLDFIVNLTGNTSANVGGDDYGNVLNRDHQFDGHYVTNGASATFTNINGGGGPSVILIKAFDETLATDANDVVGDGVLDSVNAVTLFYNGAQTTVTFVAIGTNATNFIVGGNTFTVQFVDVDPGVGVVYGARVSGVVSDTQIASFTASGYNSLEFHHAGGEDFKIGGFAATITDPGKPVQFNVPLTLTDGDGDTATGSLDISLLPTAAPAPQNFSASPVGVTASSTLAQPHIVGSDLGDTLTGDAQINFLYGGDGVDTLSGNGGNDYLSGGDGNDGLIGGLGSDILVGGLGADQFRYTSTNDGGTIANQVNADHIRDFNTTAGDVFEISAAAFGGGLIAGTDAAGIFGSSGSDTFGSAAERFHFNSATGTLLYDSNGSTAGGTQMALAVLENGGTVDAAHIKMV